ncbi:MAG: acyl-CoA dehydrogenase, partial [Calditrichae bacterium]|nr:acyl-CoA dehydrogenase [Calditrichia bacterium]
MADNLNTHKIKTEEESLQVAEAARESKWDKPSFLREMFLGKLRLDFIFPFPEPHGINRPKFQEFFNKMKTLLREEVDSDAIDRTGKIPLEIRRKLAEMGAFGMKIPEEYGGLGLTQSEYTDIIKLVTSQDGSLTALLSAHQSIGVPQPLILFGTEEQKKKYLPRIAAGAVSAFALTEANVGSDPANLSTSVTESEDGNSYILNGEKMWCTNGTIAELLVVMARHSDDNSISAFIVETGWDGVEVPHRCHFMGLKAIENGVIKFNDVKIPKENLLGQQGKGLKLALITLNTGRLALPASAVGGAKTALEIVRRWSKERVQWGLPIGKHEAIAHKISDMAATTFAMEAVNDISTRMAERDFDIRLEAAIAKLYNTEAGWKIVDDTLQIRGGRGYETADSLKARGEPGIAVERMMRDFRINLIFEGSSEILRLYIARESLDKHLEVSGSLLNPKISIGDKVAALPKILGFYLRWYPALWVGWEHWPRYRNFGKLAKHMRFVDSHTRKLAKSIFHLILVHQAKLQRKQAVLFRVVDIGSELFAMTATASRAVKLAQEGNKEAVKLADVFCMGARSRIKAYRKNLWINDDVAKYKLAREVIEDKYLWLEKGAAGLKLSE